MKPLIDSVLQIELFLERNIGKRFFEGNGYLNYGSENGGDW